MTVPQSIEREVSSNLGLLIALRNGKPADPAKQLIIEAKKVYNCAASRLERWLVAAADSDYLLRIVLWHFSKNFDDLKTSILSDLDSGFESLSFLMQIGPKFMTEMMNSALQQVACDYLWTKTTIEKAFRIWPQSATNGDKRIFRDVLIQLYKYVTKSLITWLTQHGMSIAADSPVLLDLGKVIELLLKSVQCIAHHGSLSKTHKKISFRMLLTGRGLSPAPAPPAPVEAKRKLKFGVKSNKRSSENDFMEQMKYLRREIGHRKNSVRCARWLLLAVPSQVQNEPMLLRADSLASIGPITTPYQPPVRRLR